MGVLVTMATCPCTSLFPGLRDEPTLPSLQQLGGPVHRDLPAKGQEHLDLHMHILASGNSQELSNTPFHCGPQLFANATRRVSIVPGPPLCWGSAQKLLARGGLSSWIAPKAGAVHS